MGWQVRRLRKRNEFKLIAIAGSIGKTSTKFAIAQILSQKYRVRFQEGNYNDLVTVPLVIFGQDQPNLVNPFAWFGVLLKNQLSLLKSVDFDVVVVEIGTDAPGQIKQFGRYLDCDITVLTALTPEHMEFFTDLDAVAREELTVAEYSKELVVNIDLCPSEYLEVDIPITTVGTKDCDYQIKQELFVDNKAEFSIHKKSQSWLELTMNAVSWGELYSATLATAVSDKMDLNRQQIKKGVDDIQPVSGRMQRLRGINGSLILDETYNASPDAVKAALNSLYMLKAPQKIAILGNMNELGHYSKQAHLDVGKYCDSKRLNLLVTIGPDANKYLAQSATKQGCQVRTFSDPYSAGEFVAKEIKPNAVVLVKGSQNNVYAEEAIKSFLADQKDYKLLVRQSPEWMKKKQKNFSD